MRYNDMVNTDIQLNDYEMDMLERIVYKVGDKIFNREKDPIIYVRIIVLMCVLIITIELNTLKV